MQIRQCRAAFLRLEEDTLYKYEAQVRLLTRQNRIPAPAGGTSRLQAHEQHISLLNICVFVVMRVILDSENEFDEPIVQGNLVHNYLLEIS